MTQASSFEDPKSYLYVVIDELRSFVDVKWLIAHCERAVICAIGSRCLAGAGLWVCGHADMRAFAIERLLFARSGWIVLSLVIMELYALLDS